MRFCCIHWKNEIKNLRTDISESIYILIFDIYCVITLQMSEKIDLQNPLSLQLIKKKNHLFRSDDKSRQ